MNYKAFDKPCIAGLIDFTTLNFFMDSNEKNQERPMAYPQPSEGDKQLANKPEFINQEPNNFQDKTIGKVPVKTGIGSDEPQPDEDINHQRNSEK